MRILMSGFTALQINTENRTIQKIDVPAFVVKALSELGHSVDWRRITPGEDLSVYDVIWLNLAPLHSLNGRHGAMGALYALSSGVPIVGFFDDWQFNAVFNGMRAVVRRPDTIYKHLISGDRAGARATYFSREDAQAALDVILAKNPEASKKCKIDRYYMLDSDENIKPMERRLAAAATDFLKARWEAGMVPACPMYTFGDRAQVRKRMPAGVGPIEALDPSAVVAETLAAVPPINSEMKQREWVLGALMPHDTWLEKIAPEWKVNIVGSRKLIRQMGGQRFQTEQEVLEFYNNYWGILSPPYPHAGSGWWRSRFIYSAHVGSVLVTDKGEGRPLGAAHMVTVKDVEKMDLAQLETTALEQRAAVLPRLSSYEMFRDHCGRIVERAVREDKGLKRNLDGSLA